MNDQIRIKQMSEAGKSTRQIAKCMNISNSTVSRIVRRREKATSAPISHLGRPRGSFKPKAENIIEEKTLPKAGKRSYGTKQLSNERRASIITLHNEGFNTRHIASRMMVAPSTVVKCVKRFKETTKNTDRPRSGRPRVTTNREDKRIIITSKRQRTLTAPEIREEINCLRTEPLSVTTVRRRLLAVGLRGRIAAKKPLLREANKEKRLKWAHDHLNWTSKEWSKVLFTDESKFDLFSTKRRIFVRRLPGERMNFNCVVPTVKHGGGSVLVWGSFAGTKVGDLIRITGILNKEGYLKILQENAVPNGLSLIGKGFTLQQDNDPKHSSKLCRGYVSELEKQKKLVNMEWPAQSPDLNPIELLWDELDRNVRKMRPVNHNHLWECLQACWQSIGEETLKKLINRMPRVCKAVIYANGGYFEEAKI